ncbi:MAG: hypothetical protein HKN47_02160 [Pirellulaceae bacterium]|nr:hypothetical protein [Pirellulaceae bacterium]
MLKKLMYLTCAGGLFLGTVGCDVDQVEEGRLPNVDVDVSGDPGNLPEYDVEGPDVDVQMEDKKINVPDVDVDVDTEEANIKVPDVDIDIPDENDNE